jgi:hypothetical protein
MFSERSNLFRCYVTDTYKLHSFDTATGTRFTISLYQAFFKNSFVALTDIGTKDLRETFDYIYKNIYVPVYFSFSIP